MTNANGRNKVERNISFTVKTREGSLVTFRGDDVADFVARVSDATSSDSMIDAINMLESIIRNGSSAVLTTAAATVVNTLGGEVISTPENPNFAPVAPPQAAAPVAAPAAVQAGQRMCAHGVMTKRTGTGQYGEWRGYFCPTPKGTPDQCSPVYLKKSQKAEWDAF